MTLGDDVIATVASVASWYNQCAIRDCLKMIGAIATSSNKREELLPYDNVDTVQFLKRRITSVRGHVCWAIEEKTLIKMLCMRRESKEINRRDAHAMILMNILAECWMYGEEEFNLYYELVDELGTLYSLKDSPDWRPQEFDTYVSKYTSGTLITWDPNRSEDQDPQTPVLI